MCIEVGEKVSVSGVLVPFFDCARVVVEREKGRNRTQGRDDPQKIVRREQRKVKTW
jgi:hypothetical protein